MLLRWITVLLLIIIALDVRDIKFQMHHTELKATTATELIKYWLPPMAKTRMKDDCRRCHR